MNLSLLIDKWEARRDGLSVCCRTETDRCISELKMVITGELKPSNRLDSICHFKKYKGLKWKEVIEQNPGYVNWCLDNIAGFQLDETAFNYLIEMGG